MDLACEVTPLDWRAITIAAAARLALRLSTAPTDTKVSSIPSSNCPAREPLA